MGRKSERAKHAAMMREKRHTAIRLGGCSRCLKPNDRLPKKTCSHCAESDRQKFAQQMGRVGSLKTQINTLKRDNSQKQAALKQSHSVIQKAVRILTVHGRSK